MEETVKVGFIRLVREGRVEIVNGGLSANDEACTYYEAVID